MHSMHVLNELLQTLPARLEQLPDPEARPALNEWCPKQELGHLVDSAINNHARIVRTVLEDTPELPDYDGARWVDLQRYQKRDWRGLIELWSVLNQHFLTTAAGFKPTDWARTCTIGDGRPVTLQFVFDDYIDHMLHHLRHMGIDVQPERKSMTA